MDRLKAQVEKILPEVIEHRRWLHQHAETGFELPQTLEYVKQQLEKMGYAPTICGRCGLTVSATGKPGKTILLRADMDGLPIREETGVDYACKEGNMHACGHDIHTAMLLGAAKLLKELEKDLCGTVKFMFQPAEEILSGTKDMIACGILKNVDAALMLHVAVNSSVPTGTIIVPPDGISAPAADFFTIEVKGKGCHGSMPQNGIDALVAAAHILIALENIHAREIEGANPGILTIGILHGGSADNAIADTAILKGTLRAYDEETRQFLMDRLETISREIAAAFRAKATVSYSASCPALKNDRQLRQSFYKYLNSFLGSDQLLDAEKSKDATKNHNGGSEDFAYISQQVPSVMLALAAGSKDDGYVYPLHHPKVTFDESAMENGILAFIGIAVNFLSDL